MLDSNVSPPRRVDAAHPLLVHAAAVAVPAGFPSPAQDYDEGPLDLNTHLIDDAEATFVTRVSGDSMIGAGIFDGDEVLVSRAIHPVHGDIVVAVLNGELTLKRLHIAADGTPRLRSDNPAYPDIEVPALADFSIWGTATFGIRHLRR